VPSAGGDEQLLTVHGAIPGTAELEFDLAFEHHHELVGLVHEICPYLAGAIDPQCTRKSALLPIRFYRTPLRVSHDMGNFADLGLNVE
jgi:hypothetical protein